MEINYNDDSRELIIMLTIREALEIERIISTHCFGATVPIADEKLMNDLLVMLNHELEK